jgi:hypothetical protein
VTNHTSPRARIGSNGEVIYRGPYIPALVNGFKGFPAAFRDYVPDDGKAWTIWPPYAEEALALILRYAPDTDVEYTQTSRTPSWGSSRGVGSDHYRALHLLPSAPPELVDAAYRTLAKRAHPDVGGDATTMRRLTEAHDALSRRLSA